MPPKSTLNTPGHSPTNHLSPLTTNPSTRVSPNPSPSNSFSYRRFSATNSRVSDERGSKEQDMTPPEDAVEDELEEDKPDVSVTKESPSLPTPNSGRESDRSGPLGMFTARWGGGYNNRWRLGHGPSNERGGAEEDAESSSSRAPTPVTAKAEAGEVVTKAEAGGVEGALERGLRALEREPTPPPSARKRKGKSAHRYELTISHRTCRIFTLTPSHFSSTGSPSTWNMPRRWPMQWCWRESWMRRMSNV